MVSRFLRLVVARTPRLDMVRRRREKRRVALIGRRRATKRALTVERRKLLPERRVGRRAPLIRLRSIFGVTNGATIVPKVGCKLSAISATSWFVWVVGHFVCPQPREVGGRRGYKYPDPAPTVTGSCRYNITFATRSDHELPLRCPICPPHLRPVR